MKVLSLMVGPIMTNCYILCDEEAKVCAVIDPGDEPERIAAMIASSGCTPTMILLTHGHFDHYTGVAGLLEKWPELPVYIHRADAVDGAGGELRFPRLGEKNQRYYQEGDKLTRGRPDAGRAGDPRPLSGLRVPAGGGPARDLLPATRCSGATAAGATSPAATTGPC